MSERLFQTEYECLHDIVKEPDWYLKFGMLRKVRLLGLGAVQASRDGNITQTVAYAKRQTLEIFEQLLEEDAVRLGIRGVDELDDNDEGRVPVDQLNRIVIHHSARSEGISLSTLNALQLLRLYVPVYQSKSNPVLDSSGNHQPIYSGHFDVAGKQVFYGYHWKVQQDGTYTRLLDDESLAWHSGVREVNEQSIAICIDDNLEHKNPTDEALEAVARIIREQYSHIEIRPETISGHNEVNTRTVCPGSMFVDGWKRELLSRAEKV